MACKNARTNNQAETYKKIPLRPASKMVMHQNKGLVSVCVCGPSACGPLSCHRSIFALTWEERSEVGQD